MAHDPRQLDADALQEHTRSLRGLARAIVGNANDADDLVQDAWVTALNRPPKKGWSLPSWLRGITRNHARQRSRDEGRRERRERVAAVPERLPPDDSIERIDLLRHLLDNVKGLDEPYRSTILLRYFDGLTPQQVAQKLEVPHATVRTRLHRGIEQLRTKMDDSVGGDRRAWMLPLIPFVSVPDVIPASPPVEVAAQSGQGLSALSATKAVAGLALVLTGTLATITWWPDADRTIENGKPEASSSKFDHELGTELHGSPADMERRVKVDTGLASNTKGGKKQKPATQLQVHGTVRGENGSPLAGALVLIGKQKVTTAADGTYSTQAWVYLKNDSEAWIKSSAQADGHVAASKSMAIAGNGPVQIDFDLRHGFPVFGRVVTESGDGIAGTHVVNYLERTALEVDTDHSGEFRLFVDPARPKHYLQASAAGYVMGEAVFAIEGKKSANVKIVLRRGATVRGIVYGPRRKPVASAIVTIGWSKKGEKTKSDEQGVFELIGVAPGEQDLSVFHSQFVTAKRQVQVPGAGKSLDLVIELSPGHSLTGHVRTASNEPIPHASVQLRGKKHDEHESTGDNGAFELHAVPPGAVTLRCAAKGYLTREVSTTSGIRGLVITLEKTASIAGRVVDTRTGLPVTQFSVQLLTNSGKKSKANGWSRTFANEDGLWDTRTISLQPGFTTDVEIRAKGYAPTVRKGLVTEAQPERVRISVDAGTILTGRIVVHDSNSPVAGATVRIVRAHAPLDPGSFKTNSHRFARSDKDGRFEFDHTASGDLQLAVEHPDWGLSLHPVQLQPGVRSTRKVLRLGVQGSLTGVVRGPEGRSAGGVPVRLTMVDVKGVAGRTWNAKTDKAGKYAFSRLPFGIYRVARTQPTGKQFETIARFVRITNKIPRQIDLAETGGGSVRGKANGFTQGWLMVTLTPEDPEGTDWEQRRTPRRTLTQTGTFSLNNIAAGTYSIEVQLFDKQAGTSMRGEAKVTIETSKTSQITIELQPVAERGK